MAEKIDLTSPRAAARQRQVQTYGTQTPLSSTAVERGSTRWLNGSSVVIEGLLAVSGTLSVSGTIDVSGTIGVSGTLNASGQINLSGSTGITGPLSVTGTTTIGGNTNITGELNVTGPTTLDGITDIGGNTTVTGTLDVNGPTKITGVLNVEGPMNIKGESTLTGDLNVIGAGNIQIGDNMLLLPGPAGGSVLFSTGATLEGTPNGAQMKGPAGTTYVYVSPGQAGITSGNNAFLTTAAGCFINNLPTTSEPANLHISSSGLLSVSTA